MLASAFGISYIVHLELENRSGPELHTSPMIALLQIADKWLTRIVQAILVALFSLMAGLAVLQVLLRTLFNGGLLWGDIAARHLVVWVGFIGAILASDGNKHFNIALLSRFLPARYEIWIERLTSLFTAAVCIAMGTVSITFLDVGIDPQSVVVLNIPSRLAALIVPIGFYMMALKYALRMLLVRAGGGEQAGRPHEEMSV